MKKIEIELWIYIFMLVGLFVGTCTILYANSINIQKQEYIEGLEQNQIEQAEEKEVYINRCKMYEELLEVNGLLDECECR